MNLLHIGTAFVLGLFVGANLGMGLICLLIVSGRCAQHEEDTLGVRRS